LSERWFTIRRNRKLALHYLKHLPATEPHSP
jgi:hypothetical protein